MKMKTVLASVAMLAMAGIALAKSYPCPACWPIVGKYIA